MTVAKDRELGMDGSHGFPWSGRDRENLSNLTQDWLNAEIIVISAWETISVELINCDLSA